ncbi:hypothetical protein RQP46_006767 [Phenoliferia psychrophenolica]
MALVPGFVTLPDVPPGANPFPAYLAALDYYAYSRPSHGFEARLAVLLAITVFMKLLIPVKGIVDLVLAFFYIIDIWLVYVNHAPQYYLGGLRVGVTTPMLLGGWALSFGSISSYLIMPNSFRPSFLTPALVNLFYIGLGVPGFAAHLIVRRQIFLKVDDIQRHSWTNALVTTTDSTACSEARRDSGWTDGSAPTLYEEVFGRRMSRAQIREMANPKGQNQVSRIDSARQIMALQRAEYDLAIISVLVLCLAGGGAVFCLLIAVFYFKNLYFTNSWPLLELCNTIPVWGWAGITILLKSFLMCEWTLAERSPTAEADPILA